MDNIYLTKTVRVKMKEEDQFFMVGDYDVNFYRDPYLDKGKEYYGLEIAQFEGNWQVGCRKWLYVPKESETTYSTTWEKLHNENRLAELMKLPRNSRVTV